MTQLRVLLTLSTVSVFAACTGTIEEAARYERDPAAAEAALGQDQVNGDTTANDEPVSDQPYDDDTSEGEQTAEDKAPQADSASDDKAADDKPKAQADTKAEAKVEADNKDAAPKAEAKKPADKVEDLATRVGVGDLDHPVAGPAPTEAKNLKGDSYKLIKNWDFGKNGTIRDIKDLDAEFMYHDHFGTIANGTNYGAVTVASSQQTAIGGAYGLNLPNDQQPVEDPARPFREWTKDSLLAYVRPLSTNQSTVSASRHDIGNGSFTAKWNLPKGGSRLGHDLVWETRVRMPKPVTGYWYSVWSAGKKWQKGAEMDVFESFGTQWVKGDAWHADSVGGTNTVDYTNWQNALDGLGLKTPARTMTDWHTWTWVYLKDDTYEIYFDGKVVQHGAIPWTFGATSDGEPVDMDFLFDFSWGHTQVSEVNIELPASQFPLTYEIDYSRVYMR